MGCVLLVCVLVASGPEVHVHDLPTGKLVRKVSMPELCS
jgi:hypothetical protein